MDSEHGLFAGSPPNECNVNDDWKLKTGKTLWRLTPGNMCHYFKQLRAISPGVFLPNSCPVKICVEAVCLAL